MQMHALLAGEPPVMVEPSFTMHQWPPYASDLMSSWIGLGCPRQDEACIYASRAGETCVILSGLQSHKQPMLC